MPSDSDRRARPTPSSSDPRAATADASDQPTEPESTASDPGCGDAVEAARVVALDRRVTELEAELDAVRGLLGGVEAIDEAVERRASIALAKVEALEEAVSAEPNGLVRERLAEPGSPPERDSSTSQSPTADAPTEQPATTTPAAERVRSRDDNPSSLSGERSSSGPLAADEQDADRQSGLGARLRDALR
jgi:hypothetical protein